MTPRRALFVQEYIIDLNGTQAAIRAGYAKEFADVEAARLLVNASVKSAIADALDARAARLQVTQDWVVRRLKQISDRCNQAAPVLDKKGNPILVENEDGDLVPAFTFDSAGANKATELLGKHLGMFKERVEHSGTMTLGQLVEASRQPKVTE